MSNRFNKSRATLPRPKVCKTPKPEPIPVAEITCSIIPNPATVFVFDFATVQILANNPAVDPTSQAMVVYATNGPPFTGPADVFLDTLTNASIDGAVGAGTYEITATFTFEDMSQCVATAVVNVVEF